MGQDVTTLSTINQITRTLDRTLSATAKRPDLQREISYYLEHIEDIKSINEFLGNDRVYRFAMQAFGLSDFSYAKAFMRRAMTDGVDSPDALVNRLTDGRYREFVETFNFHRYGETTTIFDRTRQGTVDRYVRQSLELQVGARDPNARLALYFERSAAKIETPFDILADKALTQFAYIALGLPPSTSAIDIDKQALLLTDRIDFADFKSPDRVARLITRFAAMADIAAPQSFIGPSILATSPIGLGIDLMLAMQRTR